MREQDAEEYWDFEDEPEEGIEVEWEFDLDAKPLFEVPLFLGIRFVEEEVAEEETEEETQEDWVEVNLDLHKRIAVASTIEQALSGAVWVHKKMDYGVQSFYVTKVISKPLEDSGEYWLYVELTERHGGRPSFHVPLHQFLEQCKPLSDLTFRDYDA